jgi:hypothetical protein
MARHAAKVFAKETVHVDGQEYIDCEFLQCEMVYGGGALPVLRGCNLDSCRWKLEGAAGRTMALMRTLYAAGDKSLCEGIIRDITGAQSRADSS